MKTYTITVNDQPVHIQESGPEHGPVAVLIHGWSSSSFTWAPILPVLNRRYRCIAIDLPGFGRSPRPSARPTIADYADLVAQIIETFKDDDGTALVLGHSMGGQIAAKLALQHPMLVERLVLLNPALSGRLSTRVNLLMGPHVMVERFRVLEWLLYVAAKTPLDYTDWLLKPTNFAERAMVSEADYTRIRADARRRGQGRTRAACFVAMRDGDLRGQLDKIETPMLVIWGAEDNIVPLRDAGVVAAELPGADLRIIPNAGHWPQFEQTDATLRHISLFLGLPPQVGDLPELNQDMVRLQEIAQFLNNSEIGGSERGGMLNEAQRLRLAALVDMRGYRTGEQIVSENTNGNEMYIVMGGTLEVWLAAGTSAGERREAVQLAVIRAGQVAGELALLEGTARSADMRAGEQGATVLALTQEALAKLAEEDPSMGMQMMRNLAVSLGRRLRHQNWRAARMAAGEMRAR
jgi:pimeloyl-ACP methyl ester carboxylesterase/CRP-like cAMP-binding protein